MFDLIQDFALTSFSWSRVDMTKIPKVKTRCQKEHLPPFPLHTEEIIEQKVIEGCECPVCHANEMIIRKGKFGLFLGCLKYPKCDGSRNIKYLDIHFEPPSVDTSSGNFTMFTTIKYNSNTSEYTNIKTYNYYENEYIVNDYYISDWK